MNESIQKKHRSSIFAQKSEATLPTEAMPHTARQTSTRLRRLKKSLDRLTHDLDSSKRRLRKEQARRRMLEQTLQQSKRHSRGLLDKSRQMQVQLRLLSRRLLSIQEEERKRISRELHDVIAQMLTGINLELTTLKQQTMLNTKGLSRRIRHTQHLVEKSVAIVHQFARELRPAVLDHLGLIPALHSLMKNFNKETGIRLSLTTFADLEKLNITRRTVLYRVAQEALSNIDRHARAGKVDIIIRKLPNTVLMQIKDNGRSFTLEPEHNTRKRLRLGLLGMKERLEMVGGKFKVEAEPGKGTTIHAQIPFKNGTKEKYRK